MTTETITFELSIGGPGVDDEQVTIEFEAEAEIYPGTAETRTEPGTDTEAEIQSIERLEHVPATKHKGAHYTTSGAHYLKRDLPAAFIQNLEEQIVEKWETNRW